MGNYSIYSFYNLILALLTHTVMGNMKSIFVGTKNTRLYCLFYEVEVFVDGKKYTNVTLL